VVAVTSVAPSVDAARSASIAAAGRVEFDGAHFRRDIGWREAARVAGAS
jgi:phosphoribosylamine--glycine ligase